MYQETNMIHLLLFFLAGKFYIKYFPKYKQWAATSEFFVTMFFMINFISIVYLSDIKISRIIYGIIILTIHFGLGFILDKYDNKQLVLDYVFSRKDKIVMVSYMLISLTLFSYILFIKPYL